jgi:hypothetical protein
MNSSRNSGTASKGGKRNKNKKNKNKGRSMAFASGTVKSGTVNAPVSSGTILKNPSYFDIKVGGRHSEYGPSVRVCGVQLMLSIIQTVANVGIFASATAVATTNSQAYINPGALNGRFANLAVNYTRYAFRRIKFIYITRSPSTSQGNFALSYSSDSGLPIASSFTETYPNITQMVPCVVSPIWCSTELIVDYTGTRTWYVAFDNSSLFAGTAEDLRQGVQGVLLGAPDGGFGLATNTSVGELFIEYECDLYQPVATLTSETLQLKRWNLFEINVLLKEFLKDPVHKKQIIEYIHQISKYLETKDKEHHSSLNSLSTRTDFGLNLNLN